MPEELSQIGARRHQNLEHGRGSPPPMRVRGVLSPERNRQHANIFVPPAQPSPMVFGEQLGTSHWNGVRLNLVRHGEGQATRRHGHDHACVHIVLRGMYVEHSPTGTTVACPGDVVVKVPEQEHCNRFGSQGAESLRFESDLALDLLAEPLGVEARALSLLGPDLARALSTRRTLVNGEARPGSRDRPLSPELRLLLRLREGFRSPVNLAALAAELGVHRSHLTRQFSREFGCSPQTFLVQKRVAWAAEQLVLGGDSLVGIALRAGFADQSHFTRAFKGHLGESPLRWSRGARW